LHLSEESSYRLAFDDKYIRKYQPDEELGEYDTSIFELCEDVLSDDLDVACIDDISGDLIETEIYRETLLGPSSELLYLTCDLRGSLDELSYLDDDLWDDIDKKKYHQSDEYDIEEGDYYARIVVSESELCCLAPSRMYAPSMYHCSEP
jgi:hypothetical protein